MYFTCVSKDIVNKDVCSVFYDIISQTCQNESLSGNCAPTGSVWDLHYLHIIIM